MEEKLPPYRKHRTTKIKLWIFHGRNGYTQPPRSRALLCSRNALSAGRTGTLEAGEHSFQEEEEEEEEEEKRRYSLETEREKKKKLIQHFSLTWLTSHHIIISLALTTASWVARLPYTVYRTGLLFSMKKQYVKSELHRRCTLGTVKRLLRSFSLSQSHETHSHDCEYIRRRLLVPRVSGYSLSGSSSNTTRSPRVNDTTLINEPSSDWLAMQSITEYSDNSTRRVPPLGFPPSMRSAVSVGPRPTCTLARRHGTQCRSFDPSCLSLPPVRVSESLNCDLLAQKIPFFFFFFFF